MEPLYKFEMNVVPYSDGSGYEASATVQDAGDGNGATLEISIVHQIKVEHWPALRLAIDNMVQLAGRQ